MSNNNNFPNFSKGLPREINKRLVNTAFPLPNQLRYQRAMLKRVGLDLSNNEFNTYVGIRYGNMLQPPNERMQQSKLYLNGLVMQKRFLNTLMEGSPLKGRNLNENEVKKLEKNVYGTAPKSLFTRYRNGGMVNNTGLAIVHKGEMVVPANKVAMVKKAVAEYKNKKA